MLSGNSRFFSLRHGDAVINAVRFASAFFGKGQFIPEQGRREGAAQVRTQTLHAPYYQPVDHVVKSADWNSVRAQRKQSQICSLEQKATVTETSKGFRLRLQSAGTRDVPIAVEINFREGGQVEGCVKSKIAPDSWVLQEGQGVCRGAKNQIRFGPGLGEHMFTQIRGAEPKLAGPSVYITGFTPFDRTIDFECI
jgi:hypothetical protein